jgi:DNA-binding transcriptional MerR regulator
MITVGKVAKMFGISRTTLLYYDDIGVLKPSERGENGYRFYSESDIDRLKRIVVLKEAGVSLSEITMHLEMPEIDVASMLLKRLNEMNKEIENIKNQQGVIIKLLKNNDLMKKRVSLSKEVWLGILENAGINNDSALKWHMDFEQQSPEQHQKFLLALGFTPDEIQKIRTVKYNADNKLKITDFSNKNITEI